MGVPPNHPFQIGIFHYESAILGYSHDYGNPLYIKINPLSHWAIDHGLPAYLDSKMHWK
jgi:hypothetical protein